MYDPSTHTLVEFSTPNDPRESPVLSKEYYDVDDYDALESKFIASQTIIDIQERHKKKPKTKKRAKKGSESTRKVSKPAPRSKAKLVKPEKKLKKSC